MEEKCENITDTKEKLLYFIENKGISKEEFCKKIGIDAANFRGKNKKSELSTDKIVKILRYYREISPDWLLLGEGNMLREGEVRSAEEERMELLQEVIETQRKTIELLEDRVAALEEELAQYTEEGGAAAG